MQSVKPILNIYRLYGSSVVFAFIWARVLCQSGMETQYLLIVCLQNNDLALYICSLVREASSKRISDWTPTNETSFRLTFSTYSEGKRRNL